MDDELLADFDAFTAPEQPPVAAEVPPIAAETPPVDAGTMQPLVTAPQAPTLNDFDTFTATQSEDPRIEQHRPAEVDDSTWQDIKKRVSGFLTEYTPLMAVPQALTTFAAETQQKEGTQVAEALSVKARLENIDFAYSDLADTFKAATGDKESEALIKTKQTKLNDEVVSILSDRGIEAYNDNGKLKVVTQDQEGNEVLNDLDENVLDTLLGGLTAGAGEVAGGIIGATGGALQAQRLVPPTAPPHLRGVAALTGAGIGGYTGAAVGRATDLIRNAISLNKEIDVREVAEKAIEAGAVDVAGGAVVTGIGKVAGKIAAPIAKASQRAKTLFKQGDIQGAKQVVKSDYGLTDANIDELFEAVKKDVTGWEDLTGDDLLRAKLTAVVQQQKQGKALITAAIRNNAKAAIETSKEIDFRAQKVRQAAEQFSKRPSVIKKSIAAYEKVVGKNYGEVRNLIDEALPNYKSDLDITAFKPTLDDLNKRVIDPTVKEKLANLSESLVAQKTDTVGDLIDTRQLFNKFYGKNKAHFETAPDKEALFNIQKTIDGKIDEALSSIDDKDVVTALKKAFTDAKDKYTAMFKAQDTAAYTAIFKKGASEEDIGKALVRYSKATDKDLETVLAKLSPVARVKSEFSILKQMVDKATAKGEARAIDFTALLKDIKTSKAIFKTKEAQQFLKNIEAYDKKFGKDIDIQKIAAGVSPKIEKNIATGLAGKIWMKISALRFEAMQRLIPSEAGRRLSLQKSIESALEKSRTPREFFFNASKIKGMPNAERAALKKAIKEIGEKEELLRKEVLKQDAEIKKAAEVKATKAEKVKVETKAKWDAAKAARVKKQTDQARKVQEAKEPKIGGSEDEAKQAVKNLFAEGPDKQYKGMTQEQIDELEEANKLFVKGVPELAGGTVAGVEVDEKGNVTLDPEKFLLGVLGVASIKGLAKSYKKSPKVQAKVEKALRDLASDSTRVAGDMLEKINKRIGLELEPKIIAGESAPGFKKATSEGRTFSSIYDRKPRFEISDSAAKLDDMQVENYRNNYKNIGEKIIDLTTYRKINDDTFDLSMKLKGATNTGDFVNLKVKKEKLQDVFPVEIVKKIQRGEGEESFMGAYNDILDAKEFKGEYKMAIDSGGKLSDMLKHDELFKEYPELKDADIAFSDDVKGAFLGTAEDASGKQSPIIIMGRMPKKDTKSVLLHEIQHTIQQKEGFAKGGSIEDFPIGMQMKRDEYESFLEIDKLAKQNNVTPSYFAENADYPTKMVDTVKRLEGQGDWGYSVKYAKDKLELPYHKYKRLAGEQEARAVQAKLKHPTLDPYAALKAEEGTLPEPIVKMDSGNMLNAKKEPVSKVITAFKDKYNKKGAKNFIYENSNGDITLSSIQIEKAKRDEGLGTQYMEELIRIADKNNKIVVLTPSSDFGGSKTRLEKFYKRFGFVPNKGRNKDYRFRETMIRRPVKGNALSPQE